MSPKKKSNLEKLVRSFKELNFKNLNKGLVTLSVIGGIGLGIIAHTNRDFFYEFVQEYQQSQEVQLIEEPEAIEITPTVEVVEYSNLENETIRIASFNIQVFGQSKSSKTEVMDYLSQIACDFDVMAVQEFRDSTALDNPSKEHASEIYLDLINEVCESTYEIILSERLGRTSSKEQYAFFYNTSTIDFIDDFQFEDVGDLFEREPYMAHFKAGNFDFVLINNHIKPTDADIEIPYLSQVIEEAKIQYSDEQDYIVLGDLNSDCSYLSEDTEWTDFLDNNSLTSIIPNEADTTVKASTCTYDRIIFSADTLEDYTGQWEVYRFDEIHGLDQELAEDISDHFPVWGEFYTNKDTQ